MILVVIYVIYEIVEENPPVKIICHFQVYDDFGDWVYTPM